MTNRQKSYWFDDDDRPVVGWSEVYEEEQPWVWVGEDVPALPTVLEAVNALTPKQRFLVELRWGLRDDVRYSLREVAALMGLTLRAVEKLEVRAMESLRAQVGVRDLG